MKVTMRTEVEPAGVYYAVYRDDVRVWSKLVPFGHPPRSRAGGYDFRQAAQEQEKQARMCWSEGTYNVLDVIRGERARSSSGEVK